MKAILLAILLINFSSLCTARVPSRIHETEDAAVDKSKDPIEQPVERSPIDNVNNDDKLVNSDKTTSPKKPIGIILFRQSPSIFSSRLPHQIFSPSFSPLLNHHHHFGGSDLHDDPSLRLFSLLFGNRRFRPMQPESSETEAVNASSESSSESSELDNRRDVQPLDLSSLFPNILTLPKFPMDDENEKEGQATSTNEDKTAVNFENKEKKVITIGGKKFVKTTQTKKVKNDFGHFHSVISSYEPFDEKIHDENGNEKIKPEETDEKVGSVDKKDVETSTAASEKVDSSSDKNNEKVENVSTSSTPSSSSTSTVNPSSIEKEEPSIAVEKKLSAESLSKERLSHGTDNKNVYVSDDLKNEISDKNVEIKVDQMS